MSVDAEDLVWRTSQEAGKADGRTQAVDRK